MKKSLLAALFLFLLPVSIASAGSPPPVGILEIDYAFGTAEGIEPSYQIAVWLESEDGRYLKTLFISEYLAYGGFNDPTICPNWSSVAGWDQATEDDYDATSRPTPKLGAHTLKIDCSEHGIAPETYLFCVQVHLLENYNILYRGKISMGDKPAESTAEVTYTPSKYEGGEKVLSSVSARYLPGKPGPAGERTQE
jgi:hypothetical protein